MASILRTGKLLRYFAGFTRNVVVNSMRDCESNNLLQSAPCMCGQFQNGFASNAAAPKSELSLDRQIRRLDQDARRIGRISRRDLEEVLDEIRTHRTATSSQSLLVIRCCGNLVPEELPEVRTALVQEIWKTLNSLNVPMDISHYNALLRVYLENEHQFTPTDFLAEVEAKGIEPNRVTYQRLIARYCQQGDIEGATRILEYMRNKNLPVNENVFNSLILGHSQANDLESAKGILGVMKQAGLEPSADTFTTLLCAFARHGDIDSLQSTLAECESKEIILLDKDLLDIVYALAVNGHGDHIDTVLAKLRISPGFNQDAVNIILRLVNKGYEDLALKVLRLMPRGTRVNGEPVDVGAFFIRQLVKVNRPVEKILSICRTLQEEGLNPKALTIATEAGLVNGAMNNALPLLKEMKNLGLPIRQHYFWPLICSASSSQVLDVVRRMQQEFALNPNSETIRDYVIPNLKEKNWDRVVTVLRDAGVQNSTAVTSSVYAALSTHQIAEAANIMEQNRAYYMPGIFRQPLLQALDNTNDYASFIRCVRQIDKGLQLRANKEAAEEVEQVASDAEPSAASERQLPDVVGNIVYDAAVYFRRERIEVLEKILDGLVKQGLSISSARATALSELLGSEMTPNIAEKLGKLSSGELEPVPLPNSKKRSLDSLSIDELERFIKNVEAKGENANNIKRQLLSACFRSQNLDKTLEVIERLEQEKFQIPIGVYAQLIDLYTHHKRSSDALAQYNKMRTADANFKLDNFKAVRLADQLLQEDRVEEAMQLLKENAKEAPVGEGEGSFNYVSTVWRILNAIAETGNAERLNLVFDALIKGNYVVPTNVLLGPLIKVHLSRDDIPKAIDTFEQICQQYKSTPWKNELACRLIQKEDATNLQRLTDLSTSVHGEVNSLYDLVFSFVECGRVRQARKILETPGLRTRPQRISTACDRYKNEGMLQPLEGLIEATKDLGHIDRNKIYYTLLLSYDKADETEKALGLWTKMQEEAVTPTDAFLLKLAELLKRKNMEVPFVVPEVQQPKSKPRRVAKKTEDQEEEKVESSTEQKVDTKSARAVPAPTSAPAPKIVSNISGFRRAIQDNDPDGAIAYKQRFISGDKLNMLDTSRLIELLVRADRLSEATKYVEELLADKRFPQPKIFRYYLNKIAASGDLEVLKHIGQQLTDEQKRLISFDNRFCHAYIVAGKAEQYVKQLSTEIEAAKSAEEAAKLAEKFPRGGAAGILEQHPELMAQYETVAEKYAAHNQLGPMNVLWMHLISNGQEAASKQIWDKHLSNAPRLMFQRVLQTAREQQDDKLASTVISQLRGSKISEGAIGNAYSCLIDIQTTKGNTDKALEVLASAMKDVSLENINRTALLRLKQAVEEKSQEFPYTVPEKRTKAQESSSSSSSSDDDVAPKRPETAPNKPERT